MRLLGWLVLVLTASCAYAIKPLPSQLVLSSWDTTTGLPEETIYSVTQTTDGFLWLANANGLVRYDGSSFRTYQPRQNLGGGVNQEITRMGPGPDNSVWVYSRAYGLVRFHQGIFRRAPEYPKPCNVAQILADGDGTLIVCEQRVLRIAGDRVEELARVAEERVDRIRAAARDGEGRVWVGFTRGSLARIDAQGNLISHSSFGEGKNLGDVSQILAVGANRLWVALGYGLALVEPNRVQIFTTADGLPSENIRRLTLSHDGALWVGTTKGVATFRDGRFEVVPALPPGWVESIAEDREENIWVTFAELNLYRLRKPKFLTWGAPEGLPGGRPLAVIQSGGLTWIVHAGGLWYGGERGGFKQLPIAREKVLLLEKEDSGRIWVLTGTKAFLLEPETLQVRETPVPSGSGRMLSISRDRRGRIWIVAQNGLLVGENGLLRKEPMAGLPPLVARSDVRQSMDGRLWLSVNKLGLFELRDGRAVPVSLGDNPELKRIFTFHIDSANDFWFGLDGGGLARWRNGKLARYGHEIGKPQNFIYHFAEDTMGHLWLGLRSGLVRIHKADLNASLDGTSTREPQESYYNNTDGLRSSNFGGADRTVSSLEPQTVLWLPTLAGVVRIDSREIPINRMIPPIHIQEISADERALLSGAVVSVPAGTDLLRFAFSVPTLVASNRVQVRYRLKPFDSIWHSTSSRSAHYSQVPPGTYTFTVSASNNDGIWNEEGSSIRVLVLPRFYQTWWFRILAAMFAAAIISGIYHWRTMLLRREKANLERRVEQRTAELLEAMRVAENAAQAKTDFLATMSHEIRTPMHGVLGTLELLSESGLNPHQSEYLDTARNSSNSLLAVLNDILDLSKMEAGRMDLHVAPFSLRRNATEVTRLLQAQANVQGIALSLLYDPGLPEYFEGDEIRIRQILSNLAGNAVKFTTKGEVAITISGQLKAEGLWRLTIAVRDSGIGIPPDRIPHLFQEFVQVNSSASRRFAGTGLGLAICQRLSAMMGGSIAVESELGRGSTFSFVVELPQAAPVGGIDPFPAEQPAECHFDAHILLAEDNAVNQKLAIRMLTRLGCKVTLAQNGREAVELAGQLNVPLIFMDCQMPDMDGFEASRLIRERSGPQPVIIALTANSLPGDRERCLQAGMNDYLAKPFQRLELTRLLAQYLPVGVQNCSPLPE